MLKGPGLARPVESALSARAVQPAFDPRLCELEQIHAPGAVQPHGALLAVCVDSLRVSHASANLAAVFGRAPGAVLGQMLNDVIGSQGCQTLLGTGPRQRGVHTAQRLHTCAGPDGSTLYLHAHHSGKHLCVDIEAITIEPPHRLPIIMAQTVLRSFEQAGSITALCALAVQGLKAISGFDRVMAYRFGAGGHGEVIAEAHEAFLTPYLGLRYPASDIPPQSRQLYLRQRVGSIADTGAEPVPLLVDPALDDGSPLDLSHSALRSVSPVHREYMRNMGTAAGLTVGLVQGSTLWGLLVCHHATPRVAGPELRAAAGSIGQVVSLLLASLGVAELSAQRLARNLSLRNVTDRLAARMPIGEALAAAQPDLLALVEAGGALLRLSGKHAHFGRTPPHAAAERALALLQAQAGDGLLAVDDLGMRHPELVSCVDNGSGALLLPLAQGSDDVLLWFRPELAQTVTWGGDPSSHGSVDPVTARVSPRASFAAWQQTVRGQSAPWSEVDLALARDLQSAVRAAVAQRAVLALRDSEARLGLLAEHSGVVVALSDLDGTRRYVSPAAERVLGWRPEQIVGRQALDFVHPDDQQALREATLALLTGSGQSSATYRFRRPDGSWQWVDGHARVRSSDDGSGQQDYVVVLRDATERKAAEIKLLDALDRMERMAATDGLTGLSNRRHLDLVADREWRRSAREQLPLSVLLLDADRFKVYNDWYGHLQGDDCLRSIAAQLAACAQRPGDLAARYGGEEFVLLMQGTGRDGALLLAQRLCRQVHDLRLPHEGNTGFGVVTVSIGVASAWPGQPADGVASLATLLQAADAAMYQAKAGGRNQVVVHGGGGSPVD